MYKVPRGLSQHWVQEGRLLLLLDGLDEMEEGTRTACIAAINTYHHDHLHPLVVCSRTDEYAAAAVSERLTLQQAIVVQALTPARVNTYLVQAGKPLAGLRAAVRKNSTLAVLATTPLMLHILMLTHQGTSVQQLPQREVLLRQQLWTDYVEHMVECKGDRERYPLNQTITWLGWLARQTRSRNQTIFYLKRLQPDWLPKRRRAFYRLSAGLVFGLFGGLGVGLLGGLVFGLTDIELAETDKLHSPLLGELSDELFSSLGFGLGRLIGWLGAVQHYILRFWLSCTHTFPWKAVPFLEDATARILLRRVGGGYQFTHRLLLDYFADLDAHPSLPSTSESSTPSSTD